MATIDAELLRKGAQYMLASTLDAARSAGVFPTGLKFWRNAPFWW